MARHHVHHAVNAADRVFHRAFVPIQIDDDGLDIGRDDRKTAVAGILLAGVADAALHSPHAGGGKARTGTFRQGARLAGTRGVECVCQSPQHDGRLVVLTGGPGAGKTAVLEVIRRNFCQHVAVLPEAATIVFSGGFPRRPTVQARQAAQRAIFHVQTELERMAIEERTAAVVLCDRGTVDGLAYWAGSAESYWNELGTTHAQQLARYATVIHLRTPPMALGYNHVNPVRTESADEAAALDERILQVWSGHGRRVVVESTPDFLQKLAAAVELLRAEVPPCCKGHPVAELLGSARPRL